MFLSFLCCSFVTQSILAVPVFKPTSSGQSSVVCCVLEALNQAEGRFDDRHVELLQSIALQVGNKFLEKLIFEDMKAKDDSGMAEDAFDLVNSVLLAEYSDTISVVKVSQGTSNRQDSIKVRRSVCLGHAPAPFHGGSSVAPNALPRRLSRPPHTATTSNRC